MKITTNTTDRKALVKTIAEFTGTEMHYAGPPSFAYTVGGFTIDRNSVITSENEEGCDVLKEHLIEKGFVEPEVDELHIKVPMDTENASWMRNLVYTLHARQYLLNKVTGRENFAVSDSLVESLEKAPTDDAGVFSSILSEDTGEWKGLAFAPGEVEFTFPFSEDAFKNRAYAEVAAFTVARAKEAHRISPSRVEPENEKYYLRIWLLQLGLTGQGGKESRKALLAGLKGNTAFRTAEEADKFKADQKAKRTAKKAESQAAESDLDEE